MRMTLGELRSVIREEVVRLTEMGSAPDRGGNLEAALAALTPDDAAKFANSLASQLDFTLQPPDDGSARMRQRLPDLERVRQWLETPGGWTYGVRPDGVRRAASPARGNRGRFSNQALQDIARALDVAGLRDINAAAMYYGTGGLEKVVAKLLEMM